jgi:antirestriction protein ArdC
MNPTDYRKDLTAKIIAQLESGTAPWVKPWVPGESLPGTPHNAVSERPYHGGNQLWLSCQGYADPRWCTYKQAAEQGWQVHKGEKSTTVEYWQWTKQERDAQGKIVEVKLENPRVFYASVFNALQMENVPEYKPAPLPWVPEEAAEQILKNSQAIIRHDQTDRAFYSPTFDQIHLPPKSLFPEAAGYYGTALHELGHWTGHPERLDRDIMHKFGSPEYAKEELRAELASYFLASRLGIPHDTQHVAAYVGSWIEALQKDHNEVFRAAKDAERITEFVMDFQREKTQSQTLEGAIPEAAKPAETKRVRKPEAALEME